MTVDVGMAAAAETIAPEHCNRPMKDDGTEAQLPPDRDGADLPLRVRRVHDPERIMNYTIHRTNNRSDSDLPHRDRREHDPVVIMDYTIHRTDNCDNNDLPLQAWREHGPEVSMVYTTHRTDNGGGTGLPLRARLAHDPEVIMDYTAHHIITGGGPDLHPRARREHNPEVVMDYTIRCTDNSIGAGPPSRARLEHDPEEIIEYTIHRIDNRGGSDLPLRARREHDPVVILDYTIRRTDNRGGADRPLRARREHDPEVNLDYTIHRADDETAPVDSSRPVESNGAEARRSADHRGTEVCRRDRPEQNPVKATDCDDPRDVAGYVTRSGKDECWHPRGSPALGHGDGGRDRGEDHEASSLVQQFVKVVALAAQAVHAFDPPFEDGMEPEWWQRVLREGFELQRDGYDVWQLTEQMEARIVARHDEPYELAALRWLDGLRRTWHENSEAGLEPQWGPAPEGEADYFVEDAELTMRDYWVHEARPPSCLAEGRKRRAEAARQERSRTPRRNLETGAKPQEQDERRSLLAGRVTGDGDMTSFVVKKFLLKKKDSRSLRRLVDNPEAWRKGPGVTVTASTRVLAPRAPGRGRASGSRGSSTPTACAVAPRGRGRGSSGDRPILVDDGEDDEEMDELGASFLWRSLLGLETDSDYENEEADRMPGFVNEPAYSTVYETLADQPPQAFAAMQESLPRFVELLHNDLQAIVDRVGAERGIGSSAATTRGDDEAAGGVCGTPARRNRLQSGNHSWCSGGR